MRSPFIEKFYLAGQNNPLIEPFSSISIFSADGIFGSPGIVITSPVNATIKPAPEQTFRFFTVTAKFSAAPKSC